MNVLLISAGIIEYDGRLRELIKVAQIIGNTHYITRSDDNRQIDGFHHVYKSDKEFSYLSFIQYCIKTANDIGNIDIVIADNRKAIIPALLIKRIKQVRYVIQDVRELYLINEVKSIKGKTGCLVENLLNKKFDLTICANKERAVMMKERFHLKTYPIVFENIRKLEYDKGFNQDYYDQKHRGMLESKKWRFVSTSGCSIERGILGIVKTIGNLGTGYELYLIGDSAHEDIEAINKIITKYRFNNIIILNTMGQNELKYFIRSCDIGVVNYHQKDMNNKFCASGKIYEFLYEGLPVLTTTNPPLKDLCEVHKIGLSTDDYVEGIKEITENYDNYKKQVSKFIVDVCTETKNKELAGKVQKYLSTNSLL